MATRKSPARGTGRRPAKATTTIGKTRSPAKKPLKVSAEASAPEAENNVVQLAAVEPAPAMAETPAKPMPAPTPAPEEAIVEVEAAAEPVVAIEQPAPVEDAAELVTVMAEEEPKTDSSVEVETKDETEVEMTFKPNAFTSASLFPGFPQFPGFPEFPAFGAVDMNAFVASGTAMVEGMQSIGNELMAFSRQAAERNVETTMAMFGASSMEEAIKLQSQHATGSLNDLMSESSKVTGMAMDVASKAAAPFTTAS